MNSSNICQNQAKFNNAMKTALDNYVNPKPNGAMVAGAFIYLLLIVFAVVLALRIPDSEHRILHVTFAIMAAPIYILSYFVSMIGGNKI